jgi:transcriptional regulator
LARLWECFRKRSHVVSRDRGDLLQGTLGLLIMKALLAEERHGYGIARWIEDVTEDVLEVPEGSLYPALRRLEAKGLITSRWDLSENNRRARFYALTRAGRRHLSTDASQWMRFSGAVTRVLRADPGFE